MSRQSPTQVVAGEPVGWIVVRRRGGWNAEPRVIRFTESEATAVSGFLFPEMGGYDPPADETDVFTYHPVLPCPLPLDPLREVR